MLYIMSHNLQGGGHIDICADQWRRSCWHSCWRDTSVSGERMCTILVNRVEPVNVWLGKLTALDMTPLG